MGKKSARRAAVHSAATSDPARIIADQVPVVGAREPCPCGSGRRYKACHGRDAARAADALVKRPFEGLASECDWVALREIVPAATAPLALSETPPDVPVTAPDVPIRGPDVPIRAPDVPVTLATLLPMAWSALRRNDGAVFVGLQVPGGSGDVSRDVATALQAGLAAEPATSVPSVGPPGPGPRLQDLLDPAVPLQVSVHDGFAFWTEGAEGVAPEIAASLERANAAVVPTVRLSSVEAAYWCRIKDRYHLRWVLPYDEEPLLDAMARLHAAGQDGMGEGSRYVGSFRAHGLLVPVWDLAPGTTAEALEDPAASYAKRLAEALTDATSLDEAERRARSGLLSRQVTIR